MNQSDTVHAIELIETTANMMRGMTMDPAIPKHAKEAMFSRIQTLEAFVEHFMNAEDGDAA